MDRLLILATFTPSAVKSHLADKGKALLELQDNLEELVFKLEEMKFTTAPYDLMILCSVKDDSQRIDIEKAIRAAADCTLTIVKIDDRSLGDAVVGANKAYSKVGGGGPG